MGNMSEVYKGLQGVRVDGRPAVDYVADSGKMVDNDLLLETPDGTGQHMGALKAGMLGLCGPEAREKALASLAARDEG